MEVGDWRDDLRRPPIAVTLVLPAEPPTQEEIDVILMATDAIIGQAGRSGVTMILNGSRSKKALEWEWDNQPRDQIHAAGGHRGAGAA